MHVFFPSLLMKLFLPKTNLFFSFLKPWMIMAQHTSFHVSCFMSGDDTHPAILSQKCTLGERGLVKPPQPGGVSFIWLEALQQTENALLKTSKGALFLSPSDVYVRSFPYLLHFIKTLLHKKLQIVKPPSLTPDQNPLLRRSQILM